jgi:DNA polymerase/3'-5' exonuclease PolX
MELSRRVILVLVIAAMATVTVLPCSADEKDEKNIWIGDEPRGPGRGPGPGRGSRRFELTDEEIDRVMKGLKESNPEKAKELAKLREKDPEKFRDELRRHGREEFGKIIRERIDNWRKRRRAKFLESLEKLVPKEAQELAKLKGTNPDLYAEKYELALKKYGRIIEEGRRNPELAEVLIEDLKLKKRRDELVKNIKAAQSDREKKKLVAELEEVVADRFDLIVRRKQIAYERLLRWLEELRKRIRESRGEIVRWRDDKLKNENVKKRTQDLIGENQTEFRWD